MVKYWLNLTKTENGINQYLTNTLLKPILPIMLASKMYQLVLVKYRLKIIKVEILVNQYFFFNWDSRHARLNSHYEPLTDTYNRYFIKLIFSIG